MQTVGDLEASELTQVRLAAESRPLFVATFALPSFFFVSKDISVLLFFYLPNGIRGDSRG